MFRDEEAVKAEEEEVGRCVSSLRRHWMDGVDAPSSRQTHTTLPPSSKQRQQQQSEGRLLCLFPRPQITHQIRTYYMSVRK